MIEGIDYYPKKKQGKIKFMLWLLLPALIIIAVYYFFDNAQMLEKSQTNLIVIKDPKSEETKVVTIPVNIETSEYKNQIPPHEIQENLDEIMQIFQEQ